MNDDELDYLAIAADDLALGRIAAGQGADAHGAGDDPALDLLAALRADLDLAAAAVDAAALGGRTAPAGVVTPLRKVEPARRPWFAVLTAAAAVGLFAGAVVAQDRPGQVLYPVRRAILGDSVDRVGEVSALLDRAAERISLGRRTSDQLVLEEAEELLDRADDALGDVDDLFVAADLERRLDALEMDLDAAEDALQDLDDDSGSSGSGSGSDDDPGDSDSSGSGSGSDSDSSGSGSSGSDSDSDSSGSGSGGSDDSSGSGSGSDDALDLDSSGQGSSGSGSD